VLVLVLVLVSVSVYRLALLHQLFLMSLVSVLLNLEELAQELAQEQPVNCMKVADIRSFHNPHYLIHPPHWQLAVGHACRLPTCQLHSQLRQQLQRALPRLLP
jgi:hypothetical protein